MKQLFVDASILAALNPIYTIKFIATYPDAIWILGAVFLCTTGAEALYSDLGHCGKENIRISWIFVFSMLAINYLGQASFCLNLPAGFRTESIFYEMVPKSMLFPVIGLATLSTIIASQALLTGIFTLVNEAIKLKLWTNLKVKYPSSHKGQIYIPFINTFLLAGCLSVVFIFRRSVNMEAAYGLAITLNMVVTTVLLGYLLIVRYRKYKNVLLVFIFVYLFIESVFLYSNLNKIMHGGWFTLLLTIGFFFLFFIYHKARLLRKRVSEFKEIEKVLPMFKELMNDKEIPYLTNNLVYPTRSVTSRYIDTTILYSIFNSQPKKAGTYWFLHVDITDVPFGNDYKVTEIVPNRCYFVRLQLGFKEPHLLDNYIHDIRKNLIQSEELKQKNVFKCLEKFDFEPDFKFVLINSRVATDNQLSVFDMLTIRTYRMIKSIGLTKIEDFGLNETNTIEEYIPINVGKTVKTKLLRLK